MQQQQRLGCLAWIHANSTLQLLGHNLSLAELDVFHCALTSSDSWS